MLDAILKILDRSLDYLKNRPSPDVVFLTDVIQPLHAELEKASRNYIQFFQSLRSTLDENNWSDGVESTKRAGEEMRIQRRELEAKVDAISTMLDSYQTGESSQISAANPFVNHLGFYLRESRNLFSLSIRLHHVNSKDYPSLAKRFEERAKKRAAHPRGSTSPMIVEMFELLVLQDSKHPSEADDTHRDEFKRFVDEIITHQVQLWQEIIRSYTELELMAKDSLRALGRRRSWRRPWTWLR